MRNRTNRLAPAVGLLFVALVLGACSSTSNFWDRSPCVAGARQYCPPVTRTCPPEATPQPRVRVVQPAPYARTPPRLPTQPRTPSYAPPAAAPSLPSSQSTSQQEQAVFDRVNYVRAQHSLRPLRFNEKLFVAARDHSLEQQRHGYMGHGSPDPKRARLGQRMLQAGYDGRVYAEVVAWGYTSPEAVVEGWLNSPDHRRILLDPELMEAGYSRVGQYWTGNLGAPTRLSAPYVPRTPTYRAKPAPIPRRSTGRVRAPKAKPLPGFG